MFDYLHVSVLDVAHVLIREAVVELASLLPEYLNKLVKSFSYINKGNMRKNCYFSLGHHLLRGLDNGFKAFFLLLLNESCKDLALLECE